MSAIQSENGNIGTNFAPCAKMRMVFADDHNIFRQALIGLIEGHADIHLVGEASNGEEAVDLAWKFNPDVIVMDVSMPRINGVEATRQIKTELPSVWLSPDVYFESSIPQIRQIRYIGGEM